MNERQPSLDDLAAFLAVTETETLTDAAHRLAMPLPTLSRRMRVLEEGLGRALFLRGKAGYALTADGRALAEEIGGLADVSAAVGRWQAAERGAVTVRITAGTWTSHHLARRLTPRPEEGWVPQFLPSNVVLDLARRAADIGIRNVPPDHAWLARQKLPPVTFALYGRDGMPERYVALPAGDALPPSQAWLHRHHGTRIATTATDPRLCLDMALAGFGRIILPAFVGDETPGLIRYSDEIAELTNNAWLVSHQDTRHLPPIRAALRAIRATLAPD